MRTTRNNRPTMRLVVLILLVAVASAALFLLCYYGDNKYTAKSPRGENGVLMLSESDLQEPDFVYLTTGWELYRGKLLSPEDFSGGPVLPDEHVFIGQYSDLGGAPSTGRNPHSSATYRLNITLPAEEKSYLLEVPEIYSAYRLYINGVLMEQMGEPNKDGYYAETGNSRVSIRCADSMEIIVAVSDYSHFYSGMVYPPAFGEASVVGKVLDTRLGLRFVGVTLSLGVGVLYLGIWLLLKKNKEKVETLPLYYTALCLCFALYICYPIVKTLTTTGNLWYTIENLALPALLLLVTVIQSRITRADGLPTRVVIAMGIFVCCWAVAVPVVMGDSRNLMLAHSVVLTAYTWIAGLYLLATSVHSAYKDSPHSKIMLTGAVVFGVSLVMDRLFPMFEPIRFGWFSELAGGFFVLSIGVVMAQQVAGQFRLRTLLEGRVDSVTRMMEVQKTYYPEILKKEEELRLARHDFHHHITVIRELAAAGDLPKLLAYTASFHQRGETRTQTSFCKHYVTDTLLRLYADLAKGQDTAFVVEATLPEALPFDDLDLCVMMSNLLENALEASAKIPKENRKITVRMAQKHGRFIFLLENQFNGKSQRVNGQFFSSKAKERKGIGLASVSAIVASYGGSTSFYTEGTLFNSEIFLPTKVVEKKEGDEQNAYCDL